MPENLCFERAALAETICGSRMTEGREMIVQRVELISLAFKSVAPGKAKFDLDYLGSQIEAIRDGNIQRRLKEFHATTPGETQWKEFCEHFTQADGGKGSRVRRLLMNVGEPTEYKDLSKDGTGAFRRRAKEHKGQLVYVEIEADKKGKPVEEPHVRPIYVHESPGRVRKEVAKKLGQLCRMVGFFQSGCIVELTAGINHAKKPLPPGKYRLNTIRADCQVRLTTADGKTYPDIPFFHLNKLLAAGFRRVK